MIKRIYDDLEKYLKPNKVLVIYGPRRVGKTTLLSNFLSQTTLKYKLESGDNVKIQNLLSSQDFGQILPLVEGYELFAIDEAQNIPNIGMALKIIVDQTPKIKVIATGSSSFELSGQIGEPLTGRKTTLTLFPIAQKELAFQYNEYELKEKLEDFLIFGSYPEVVIAEKRSEKIALLEEITNSYLFKDILSLEKVKASKILFNLLRLLAFQIGSQVSLNEIASKISIDVKTVDRYLDLLEKSFVITKQGGLSKNLRDEVTSKYKYYFLDNGIRNAIISQFNSLELRNDIGQLWENFIVIERTKKRSYENIFANTYFWRTYSQQEIDLIEEKDDKFSAYECKWAQEKKVKPPKKWQINYPNSSFLTITPQNYLKFVNG